MKSFFIPLVCVGMLLSGLLHLFLSDKTEKYMSRPGNVRVVGGILLALVVPATVWGFYVLAVLFVIFGLSRVLAPRHSIRLQQRSYPRRVHEVLLMIGAVCGLSQGWSVVGDCTGPRSPRSNMPKFVVDLI